MTNENQFRIEKDSIGEKEVPVTAYYGIQTVRAIENFPITGYQIEEGLIKAIGIVKKCSALANKEIGQLEPKIANAIVEAADPVAHLGADQEPVGGTVID